ncbi:MAG TPA: hypothetical protein VFF04_04780 [Candidatus Babeliales bacterium]|nr:hypothetical protein [Candidatus Babeliales bacterium]
MKYFYYIALLFFTPLLPSEQASAAPTIQSFNLVPLAITLNGVNIYVPSDDISYYTEHIERWNRALVFVKETDKAFNATRLVVLGEPESIENTIQEHEDLLSFLKKPCISLSLKSLTCCVPQLNNKSASHRKVLQKPLLQEMSPIAQSDQKNLSS